MSDITSPTGVVGVQWQEEKPASDGEQNKRDVPANKVAETYAETSRGINDSITILGIPVDLMTTQVQATIGGLVSEVQFLKTKVKRYEASMAANAAQQGGQAEGAVPVETLVGERLLQALDKALSIQPQPGFVRELALIVVNTFEDIRKSSGVLAANSVLADVSAAIQTGPITAEPVGIVGGPVVAALLTRMEFAELPQEPDEAPLTTADRVRQTVEGQGYAVAGLDMNLSFTVASVRVETGQSALQAIGQADHILRA